MVGFEIDDRQIAIYRIEDSYFATANVCTHAFALLSDGWLDGDTVECPLHGACFNVCTGKAMSDPAEIDLEVFETRVTDNIVEIFLPEEAHRMADT
ncbi:Ferredoxin, 2Fe-2S [Sulfitobacter geojensis]|nr:Ferredoxin, 2Fe-2S [Sulfitobacter geojensis]